MTREIEFYRFMDKKGKDIGNLIEEKIFLDVCNGDSYFNWDENYWCMVEQQYCEARK